MLLQLVAGTTGRSPDCSRDRRRRRRRGAAPPASAQSRSSFGVATSVARGRSSRPGRVLPEQVERPPISSERTAFCSAASNDAVDRHHLAGRLHLRAERAVAERELVERPARDLDDAVVERRLEGGRRLAGDGVRDLVQPLADGDLGRDAGDRVAGRLRGQRRGAADARVDLDDVVAAKRVAGRARTGRCSRPRCRARG